MRIKGTAVKSLKQYIIDFFPERYNEWFETLSEESKKIFSDVILATEFYDLKEAILKPTEVAGVLFFNGDVNKAAYEMGKYSGTSALSSFYKIFVKISSLDFVLKRATSIYSTYYDDGKMFNTYRTDEEARFAVTGLKKGEELNMKRIAGWADAIFTVISKSPSEIIDKVVEYKDDGSFDGELVLFWR